LKISILSAVVAVHLGSPDVFASCSKILESGTLIKTEEQSISGYIYGYNEYTYKGSWFPGIQYSAGDSVMSDGLFWTANQSNLSQEPSRTSTYWSKSDARKYKKESHSIKYNMSYYSSMETSDYLRQDELIEENDVIKISSLCQGSYYSTLEGYNGSFEQGEYNSDCETTSGSFFSTLYDPEMT